MESIFNVLWFALKVTLLFNLALFLIGGMYVYAQTYIARKQSKFEADAVRKGYVEVLPPSMDSIHPAPFSVKRILKSDPLKSYWVRGDIIEQWKEAKDKSLHAYRSTRRRAWNAYAEKGITNFEYVTLCEKAMIRYRNKARAYERLTVRRGLPPHVAQRMRAVFYDCDLGPIEVPPALSPSRNKDSGTGLKENIIPFRYRSME